MNLPNIYQIDRLYAYSAGRVINYERVNHELFMRWSSKLRQFKRALGDQAADPFWADYIRALNRYHFWLSSTPLAFNDARVVPSMSVSDMDQLLSRVQFIYPQRAEEARVLAGGFFGLVSCPDNPLLDRIEALANARSTALVLLESRLVDYVLASLQSKLATRRFVAIGPGELRDVNLYDRLVLLGSARWYPDYVFTAPRAPEICVVSYRWVRSRWRPRLWLNGADEQSRSSWDHDSTEETIESVDEPWPGIDWVEIERVARTALGEDSVLETQDEVEARLFALHGGQAVFLEEQEGATCLAIDLREDEKTRVKRVATADLEPGIFVLLRTEGGGDYVVPVADRLLGEKAFDCRIAQREWKSRLRTLISTHGIVQVTTLLRQMGVTKADETNVRHWASDRNIATQAEKDFATIMKLLSLEGETERYWRMMRTIRAAHLSAGMTIRRGLLSQVRGADLAQLRREGRLDFRLPEAEGGKLTALRVEARAPNTNWVPASRAGRVFDRPD